MARTLAHPLEGSARRRARRLASDDLHMVIEQSATALQQASDRYRKEPGAEARHALQDSLLGAVTSVDELLRREEDGPL